MDCIRTNVPVPVDTRQRHIVFLDLENHIFLDFVHIIDFEDKIRKLIFKTTSRVKKCVVPHPNPHVESYSTYFK